MTMRIFLKGLGRVFWYFLAFVTMIGTLSILYFMVHPIDVIEDSSWKLSLEKDTYSTGEVVVVHTEYRKLKAKTGQSSYYLYCDNDPSGTTRYARYDIGTTLANRPVTKLPIGRSDVYLRIPADKISIVPNDDCYIEFSTDYGTFYQAEANQTKHFKLTKGDISATDDVDSYSTDNQVVENAPTANGQKPNTKKENPLTYQIPTPEQVETPSVEDSPVVPPRSPVCVVPVIGDVLTFIRLCK